MRTFNQWSTSRFFWFLLILLIAFCFGYAWHVQYRENMPPCFYCVLDRYYLSWIGIAGIIGFIKPKNSLLRLVAILLFLYGSIMGVINSVNHLIYLSNHNPFSTCPVTLNTLIPIQTWIPSFFTPIGNCNSGGPEILSFNMVQLTAILFIILAIVAIFMLIAQLFKPKQSPFRMHSKLF